MIDRSSRPRIHLAHDWLVGMRGGERVLDRLAQQFGPTTLYTLVDDGRPLSPAISACRTVTSPLQRFPGAPGRWRRRYLPLYPWAVGRLRVEPCDLLISTSSAVMKSIRPPAGTPHLCYCHSPARYVWEQTSDYARGRGGIGRRVGLAVVGGPFRRWDRRTASRVSRFLANSRHTADRIERCYGREADVVYPPVRTTFFTTDESVPREDWLLVVSALEPYKRVEVVIDAANRAGWPLRIAGDGSQREALARRAGPGVTLLGRVDDLVLRDLYRRARGLVFPQVEDFGIVAVEAQATGCPVIARARGGAMETVTDETGVLFEESTAEAIVAAAHHLETNPPDPGACRANAERFAESVFDEAMARQVEALLGA
ncbi:MAG: glycosyltransferase [Planctomycetota bacterium]|jgi:glycosyltransferase involved in cell wall biosynthesis